MPAPHAAPSSGWHSAPDTLWYRRFHQHGVRAFGGARESDCRGRTPPWVRGHGHFPVGEPEEASWSFVGVHLLSCCNSMGVISELREGVSFSP